MPNIAAKECYAGLDRIATPLWKKIHKENTGTLTKAFSYIVSK